MKALIFCGGRGTRYNKSSTKLLKPLVKIKNISVLERIIIFFEKYGIDDFILMGGYKFNDLEQFSKKFKNIRVRAIFTGVDTPTAGRLRKVKKYLNKNENFFLTYGDSIIEYNLKNIINKKKKTNNYYVCSYKYQLPYGIFDVSKESSVQKLSEKKISFQINSGFYFLDTRIFNFIKSNNETFEKEVVKRLIKSNINLDIVKIKNWMPMDNIIDKYAIEKKLESSTVFNTNRKL